jgi:hypothetical protein
MGGAYRDRHLYFSPSCLHAAKTFSVHAIVAADSVTTTGYFKYIF